MTSGADTLTRINGMSHADAVDVFMQCCASRRWAEGMAAERPYNEANVLYATADRLWRDLGPHAWHQAFDGHPRIGERKSAADASETAQQWSANEQATAAQADPNERAELAALQRQYEARFGHIFLICATGRTSAKILEALKSRLSNDADTELAIAAREQGMITRLRLEKLLTQ